VLSNGREFFSLVMIFNIFCLSYNFMPTRAFQLQISFKNTKSSSRSIMNVLSSQTNDISVEKILLFYKSLTLHLLWLLKPRSSSVNVVQIKSLAAVEIILFEITVQVNRCNYPIWFVSKVSCFVFFPCRTKLHLLIKMTNTCLDLWID
jgi:hypothetical protein